MPPTSDDETDLFSIGKRFHCRKEDVLQDIKIFAESNGLKPITQAQYKNWKNKKYSVDTIRRMFGSWRNECSLVGNKNAVVNKYSDNELITHFEKIWRWRGMRPSVGDFKLYNKMHKTTITHDAFTRRWGSFPKFCTLFSQYKLGQITYDDIIRKKTKKISREPISPRLRALVLNRDNYTCRDCGRSPRDDNGDIKLHIHHVIPVSKGGKTALENLVTNCQYCNLGKSDIIEENN